MGRRLEAVKRFFGIPTNYGAGYLTDGTYVTYLRDSMGIVRIQTPLVFFNRPITRQAGGTTSRPGWSSRPSPWSPGLLSYSSWHCTLPGSRKTAGG